jgi:hypothetical protein
MRRFDKIKNIKTANMLTEQRYLESKGLVNENFEEINEVDRMSMSEFFGDVTDNVETLLKMFSKYQPNQSWFMSVGYVNNVDLSVTIKNENMPELENIARKLGNPAFSNMVDSEEWSTARDTGKNFKNPYAPKTEKGEKIPSRVYSTKSFTIQWGNMKNKADKDADVKKVYDKYGIEWPEGGEVDTNDWRGRGWEPIQGTPFSQHKDTGTKRLAIYAKKEGVKAGKTKYFLNFQDDIAELTPEETSFIFSLSPKSYDLKMPKRLLDMENQEAAQEIFALENTYDFKSLDLEKISYIRCTMQINGENKKFSYFNRNVAPAGLNAGDFAKLIDPR